MFKSGEKLFLIDTQVFHDVESNPKTAERLRKLNASVGRGSAVALGGRPKQFLVARETLEGLVEGRESFVEDMFFDRVRYAFVPSAVHDIAGVYEGEELLQALAEGVFSGDLLKCGAAYVGTARSFASYVVEQPDFIVRDAVSAMLRRGWLELVNEGSVVESAVDAAVKPFLDERRVQTKLLKKRDADVRRLSGQVARLQGEVVEVRGVCDERVREVGVLTARLANVQRESREQDALRKELEVSREAFAQEVVARELLRGEYAEILKERDVARGDVERYKIRVAALEEQVKGMASQEAKVEGAVLVVQKKSKKEGAVVADLRSQVKSLARVVARYEAREEERELLEFDKTEEVDERVVVLEQSLERLAKERSVLRDQVGFLWEELQVLESALGEYEPVLETVKQRFDEAWNERKERYALANRQLRHSTIEPRVGEVVVPEASQLYLMYDLLHYMELHGERLPTDSVISVLDRGRKHKEGVVLQADSKLRYFERFKKRLKRVGVEFVVDFENGADGSYFVVRNPGAQKEYVNALIVMREVYGSSRWKQLMGAARGQGVSGLYLAADKGALLDERLLGFRIIQGGGVGLKVAEVSESDEVSARTAQPGA